MNKAIFLDIDGVLNLFGESYNTNSVAFDTHFQETITRMEFHLVKRLEYIINETDADIILISAWDLDSSKIVLKQNDFKRLDKLKSKLYSPDRVEGILEYIKDNNITDYIVLDDEIDIPKALNLAPKGSKSVKGFQTGDIVKAVVTKGKKQGTYLGRVIIGSKGYFNIDYDKDVVDGINSKYCYLIQKGDGYSYKYKNYIKPYHKTKDI